MIWQDGELKSPLSGRILRTDSPHSFADGATRFPVIENIPFLRADRDALRAAALKKLDAGDDRGALILLLRDQDDWAKTPPPAETDLSPLFEDENLTLRDAMNCLRYGAVADYFAYRWSDPTFLSGLRLLENHLPEDAENVFELACGIGHFLREFVSRNIRATGADVVFSKLWLARKFVAPMAKLICFDANFAFPFADRTFDAAFCHDAFYFLPDKRNAADELKRIAGGAVLIGHAHNAEAENYSSGAAISTAEYAALFAEAIFYNDAELTKSFVENRRPNGAAVDDLKKAEAVSLATTSARKSEKLSFGETASSENLRVNPLFETGGGALNRFPKYPSERYEKEYAALSDYLFLTETQAAELEKTGAKNLNAAEIADLMRRRILLNLPKDW